MRLKVMSFNLRYENPHDKGETNWQNRKEKVRVDNIEVYRFNIRRIS